MVLQRLISSSIMTIVAVGGADGLVMSDFFLFFSPNFFCTPDLSLCVNCDVPY